jgi:hypothetical protein
LALLHVRVANAANELLKNQVSTDSIKTNTKQRSDVPSICLAHDGRGIGRVLLLHQLHGLLAVCHAQVELLLLESHGGAVEQVVGVAAVQLDGAVVLLDGSVELALLVQLVAGILEFIGLFSECIDRASISQVRGNQHSAIMMAPTCLRFWRCSCSSGDCTSMGSGLGAGCSAFLGAAATGLAG